MAGHVQVVSRVRQSSKLRGVRQVKRCEKENEPIDGDGAQVRKHQKDGLEPAVEPRFHKESSIREVQMNGKRDSDRHDDHPFENVEIQRRAEVLENEHTK
jgi:hypothetical protein